MIAIDTNVVLRYLLRDDELQSARAHRLFQESDAVLITDIVLAETVWTLLGRRYRATGDDVISTIERLLEEPHVQFEDDQAVWSALQAYRRTDARFADALIVYKAHATAARQGAVLEAVCTFDHAGRELPNTRAP